MVVAQVVIALPIVAGLTMASFQNLDPRLTLQLLGIGASKLQLLWLLCKEARLPLLAAVMAGFGGVISEVGASMMVGGNIRGQTRVLTTATVLETGKGNFDVAIALSVILLLLTFAINFFLTRVQQREPLRWPRLSLRLRDILVRYGAATALDIAALEVKKGEVLAIIGANGAGKSTLLRVMGLLQPADHGTVEFPGFTALPRGSLALRRRIATVFQQPLLIDDSVYRNVALGLRLRGLAKAEIRQPGHAMVGSLGD